MLFNIKYSDSCKSNVIYLRHSYQHGKAIQHASGAEAEVL